MSVWPVWHGMGHDMTWFSLYLLKVENFSPIYLILTEYMVFSLSQNHHQNHSLMIASI